MNPNTSQETRRIPSVDRLLAALGADASAVAGLRRENDGKADILFYDSLAKGAPLADGLQKAVEAVNMTIAEALVAMDAEDQVAID